MSEQMPGSTQLSWGVRRPETLVSCHQGLYQPPTGAGSHFPWVPGKIEPFSFPQWPVRKVFSCSSGAEDGEPSIQPLLFCQVPRGTSSAVGYGGGKHCIVGFSRGPAEVLPHCGCSLGSPGKPVGPADIVYSCY